MGHSKHKLSSKKNMLYSPKKVVTWHPYLQITATSLQQLLSSVPKVVAWEQQTYFYVFCSQATQVAVVAVRGST